VWRCFAIGAVVSALCGQAGTHGLAQGRPAAERADTVIETLRNGNVEARRTAALTIRLADKSVQIKALPVMIDVLMKEKDGQVRLAVFDAVTALGHDAEPAIPALVHTLRTDYGGQRLEETHQDYRSALALAAIGKPAVESLRSLLAERKENVRAEVVMALGHIGPDADAAVPDMIGLLGDKNERIRRETSVALGRIGEAAVQPLIVASANQDVAIRTQAVEALGNLSSPTDQIHDLVLKCAVEDAPEVRVAAVHALGRFAVPGDQLVPVLTENLRQKDEGVRVAVVSLIVARPPLLEAIAPKLDALLTADDEGVSRHAAYLVGKIGPGGTPRLLQALRDRKSRVAQIAEALAQIGRPIANLLAEAIKDPEPRVRQGAALALSQIRPLIPGTAKQLTVGLDDSDRDVRAAFLTAIGYLGPRARDCAPAVRKLLRDPSADIRIRAIEILAQAAQRDEQLVDDVSALIDDADPGVQKRAIDTVRASGPMGRKALPVIAAKLRSSNLDVRVAAAEFVGSQGTAAAEALPALTELLDDASPKLRTIAAQTLGKLGKAAQPALERLTPFVGAEQPELREAAITALGSMELGAEALRPYLAKALTDENIDVRRAAGRAIGRLGPEGAIFVPDIILLAAKKEGLRSAERLLRRFERKGPDLRSVPELVQQLEHKQEGVRLLAIKFLGLAGASAKDALPALERMREDPSAEVRKQAEAAAEQIKNNTGAGQRKATEPDELPA
jgi:HEAT repeat protein